ncbi:hypothetical protein GI584_11515 [Gracilibacillus salitolerans]|uniref:Uncharacterized protein n=1 Tax=Gracilibacillus salitolerans TaxID=2663022 RepID=A0A5Q2TKI1_9BACI|nr:hypothetical protein [Gracilibacillus salitolerans]QGH34621.1 hypothetical protein GI584_11515 [Gracilibacillus salitolerans]
MILVTIDHSYVNDYFQIDTIEVNLDEEEEKVRVEKLAKKLEGALVDPDRLLSQRIADELKVDVRLIDLDTNEIDLM